jgi:hypothetical protein
MANRPPPGICAHCLQFSDDLTWDHVFPQAWYPETTPLDLEKWKMPACQDCNARFGRLERDLLVRLGLCVPPATAATAGIVEKVLRGLDPNAASSKRDRRARAADRERITKELVTFERPPNEGVLPGLGVHAGSATKEFPAVLIPSDSLERLAESSSVVSLTCTTEQRLVPSTAFAFMWSMTTRSLTCERSWKHAASCLPEAQVFQSTAVSGMPTR